MESQFVTFWGYILIRPSKEGDPLQFMKDQLAKQTLEAAVKTGGFDNKAQDLMMQSMLLNMISSRQQAASVESEPPAKTQAKAEPNDGKPEPKSLAPKKPNKVRS